MYLIPKHKELSWHIPDRHVVGQANVLVNPSVVNLVLRVFIIYSPINWHWWRYRQTWPQCTAPWNRRRVPLRTTRRRRTTRGTPPSPLASPPLLDLARLARVFWVTPRPAAETLFSVKEFAIRSPSNHPYVGSVAAAVHTLNINFADDIMWLVPNKLERRICVPAR